MVAGIVVASLWAAVASAFPTSIELSGGAGIPVQNFLDGTSYDVVQNINVGKFTTDVAGRFDATNSPGFNAAAALVLGHLELRYMFVQLPWDKATLTHLGASLANDTFVYLPLREGVVADADIDQESPLRYHTFTAGWRFYVLSGETVRPFIPLAAGFALGMLSGMTFQFPQLEDSAAAPVRIKKEKLPGFSLQTGFGADFDISEVFDLGLRLRYSFTAFRKPALESLDAGAVSETGSTGDSLMETVMETVHLLSFDVALLFDL